LALNKDRSFNAVFFAFAAGLAMYVAAAELIGNLYQVWKFASYVPLPLSFVPLALLCRTARRRFSLDKRKAAAWLAAALFLLAALGYGNILPLRTFAERHYNLRSGDGYYEILKNIGAAISEKSVLALHISKHNENLMALNYFSMTKAKRIYALDVMRRELGKKDYYRIELINDSNIMVHKDYQNVLEKTDFVVSDTRFDGLFNGRKSDLGGRDVFVYDSEFLRTRGYASLLGTARGTRETLGRYFRVTARVPEPLAGEDAEFYLSFETIGGGPGVKCDGSGTALRLLKDGAKEEMEAESGENFIRAALDGELTAGKFLRLEARLPPEFGFLEGPCSAVIDEVAIRRAGG
jgi:hypothetical protein